MGGKKPPGKSSAIPSGKAKAKAAAAPEDREQENPEKLEAKRLWQQRREASKWAKAALDTVRGQLEAAKGRGSCDWLQVAHEFHEVRLIKVCKRLEEKTLDAMPQQLREGLEAYVAQCAGGAVPEREGFHEDRQLWELLPAEATDASYIRPPESPGAEEARSQAKAWADASEQGMAGLAKLMREWEASAGVTEAGLTRLSGLFSEAREDGATPGLTAARVMPVIEAALRRHTADAPVQRAGCAALRGLAMAEGQLPGLCDRGGVQLAVEEAVRVHLKVADVVSAANGAFWAIAKAAGKNSPELSTMRNAGVVEVLKRAMDYHAWDQTLCGRVRVTLPFITED